MTRVASSLGDQQNRAAVFPAKNSSETLMITTRGGTGPSAVPVPGPGASAVPVAGTGTGTGAGRGAGAGAGSASGDRARRRTHPPRPQPPRPFLRARPPAASHPPHPISATPPPRTVINRTPPLSFPPPNKRSASGDHHARQRNPAPTDPTQHLCTPHTGCNPCTAYRGCVSAPRGVDDPEPSRISRNDTPNKALLGAGGAGLSEVVQSGRSGVVR
jgi:hypothetical protein